MHTWERDIIRELAKERLEISKLPIMDERAKLWTKHNDLQGERPMIFFEPWTIADEGFFYNDIKCETPMAVRLERLLGGSLVNHKMIGDDRVVTSDFVCKFDVSLLPFNMPIKKEPAAEGLGFHIVEQIKSLEDTSIIAPSGIKIDLESSKEWFDFTQDAIGDILQVRHGMDALYAPLTNEIVHRMGMENMYMEMYDNPDGFHYMMDSLSNDYVAYFRQLEAAGAMVANNKNDYLAQGSWGFSGELPDVATKASECWGYMDSQETVSISPDMFHEFFFPYYKKVADNFGLLSYGCCEAVHSFWDKSLSKFENLRKISISPWCDEQFMGEKLTGSNVIYQRKPSPNFIGVDVELNEDGFREHIRATLNAAKGCKLEISFRDVYNLSGRLDKPRRAVEITREEIENNWQA